MTDGAKPLSWFDRLRRRLARLLILLQDEPAAGGINPDHQFSIDDGVNYDLPLVVPEWATDEQKTKLVQAAVREADSRYHFQFDRPYLYKENLSLFPTADPLKEWNIATRKEIISRSHLAWERNPLANAAVGLTTLFSVGQGFTISYRNKDVEEVVEAFRADPENGLQEYEKSFCDSLQLDGEVFVKFHDDKAQGQTVITPIPPWEIDWIETEREFKKRIIAYHRNGSQSSGKPGDFEYLYLDIPASEVLHVTINKLSYETRGRPELFRIMPWLKAYKDWLEGRARQNHWRGSMLWDVSLEGATPSQVATKRAQYKQPPPPGSLAIHNEKEKWSSIESKVGAADVSEDGRQMKLMAAVGARLPEYMLSDGQNSNLASASAQQLPALRKFVDFQDILIELLWKPIYKRVIQNAIDAGILPEEVEEQDEDGEPILELVTEAFAPQPANGKNGKVAQAQSPAVPGGAIPSLGAGAIPAMAIPKPKGKPKKIKTVEAFDLTGPELETDDPKTLAEALQIAVTREWVSNETAASNMGYDYRLEQKKIEREKAQNVERMYQGMGGNGASINLPGAAQPVTDRHRTAGANGNGAQPNMTGAANEQPQESEHHGIESQLAALRTAMQSAVSDARETAITGEVKQALSKTERLETQLQIVNESVKDLARPLTQREQREAQMLDSIALLLNALEDNLMPQPVIQIDEATLLRVASVVAEKTASKLSVVSQEVIERDNQNRALVIRRITADGQAADYRIDRNWQGAIETLSRIDVGLYTQ